jgi:leucyl aminopeptidase
MVESKFKFPKKVKHSSLVENFISMISTDEMLAFLTKFTSFHTRYYKSSSGRDSSAWLLEKVTALAKLSNNTVTVSHFPHSW